MSKVLMGVLLLLCSVFSAVPDFVQTLQKKEFRQLDTVAGKYVCRNGKTLKEMMSDTLWGSRLYNFAAWYTTRDKEVDYIIEKVKKREQTFFPEKADSFTVAAASTKPAGDSAAPFEIVAYISSTCPHCKKVGIPLYEKVTEGVLKGKARFVIKPIHKKVGDYALLSADRIGKMWDLFKAYGEIKKYLDEEQLLNAVEIAGIDIGTITNDIEKREAEYKTQVSENYAECKRNKLEFTPTLYVNGVRYYSNKRPMWVEDYIEFLWEMKSK